MKSKTLTLLAAGLAMTALTVQADPKLPNVFGDHMVLQQKHNNPVWGWAEAGEKIT